MRLGVHVVDLVVDQFVRRFSRPQDGIGRLRLEMRAVLSVAQHIDRRTRYEPLQRGCEQWLRAGLFGLLVAAARAVLVLLLGPRMS
jgi:hypothetical protein